MLTSLKVEKDTSDGIVYRVVTRQSAVVMAECRSETFANQVASTPEIVAERDRLKKINADLLEALKSLVEFSDNGTPLHPGALAFDVARGAISLAKASTL